MAYKLFKVIQEFNVGLSSVVDTLHSKGFADVEAKPTTEISDEMYQVLRKEFQKDIDIKNQADKLGRPALKRETVNLHEPPARPTLIRKETPAPAPPPPPPAKQEEPVATPPSSPQPEMIKREVHQHKILGKIDLDKVKKDGTKATPPAPAAELPGQSSNTPTAPPQAPPVQEVKAVEPPPKPAAPVAPPVIAPEAPKPAAVVVPTQPAAPEEAEMFKADTPTLRGLKILGKIDTEKFKDPPPSDRNRNRNQGNNNNRPNPNAPRTNQGNPNAPRTNQGNPNRPGGNTPAGANPSGQPRPTDPNAISDANKRKRKRKKVQTPVTAEAIKTSLTTTPTNANNPANRPKKPTEPKVISQKEIEDQIRATKARMDVGSKSKRGKIRRTKRDEMREKAEMAEAFENEANSRLLVTEFITVSELASIMNVTASEVIKVCMSLGIFVGINQRLDAEIIEVVTGEFGFDIQFVSAEQQVEVIEEEEEDPNDLIPRQPIVTVMGHVDHGKTSLLDFIRKANVMGGEAGGITQHIGAYEVGLAGGKKITFLDTPGHEAFTAMRARGAKVTDIAVILIAADDSLMPQTKEAISHAQAAGVPIVFAINKIDKAGADPEKIKAELAQMNLLVEDWGGKYQSQDISAKQGLNVDKLLEKILLEAELLDLKANPKRRAIGTLLEASMEKGRGYVAKVLVETGTLRDGDPILVGEYAGKVKALFNERNQRVTSAGPGSPVLVLGLQGAPQAGEKVRVTATDGEAKEIATKRAQIMREQSARATKRISLEEIGRRLALGSFKELKLIVKGDFDGSVEALADSLIKLGIESVQVSVIHKAVGAIVDSDIMLASASDAIIIGFQVRPTTNARKLAEAEGVEIKLYSIIYEAIDEVKSAIEGLMEPTKEEEITGTAIVRELYKNSKIGNIAGCYVQEGKIARNNFVRIIRDGIVVFPQHEGGAAEFGSLKRFKDDVRDVKSNLECGLTIKNFNDLRVDDLIETFVINEVKRKLD